MDKRQRDIVEKYCELYWNTVTHFADIDYTLGIDILDRPIYLTYILSKKMPYNVAKEIVDKYY